MQNKQLRDKIDTILASHIPSNGVPGARFVALARNGGILYSGSAGTLNQGSKEPVTEDTVFWLASCTKLLTALCAMKCVDLGLITLDEDALPYLPELQQHQVLHNYGTPEFKLVPREGTVTLRQLLSMTAGTSYPILALLLERFPTIPTGTEPFMHPTKAEALGPFECQPGTKWAYSGALDWTGQLVEKLSGLSLGDFLYKHILEPCGVKDITFHLTSEMKSKLAGAHFRWPDGKVTPRGKILSDNVEMHLGGAGSYGTPDAYAQVLLPLLNGGKHPITGNQILKPETVKEMFRPQLNEEQLKWLYQPTPANNMQIIMPGIAKQWGLGFMLLPEGTPGGRGAGSATWAGFANTHWLVDPTNGVAMVIFGQLIPQEDPKLLEARDQCEDAIYKYLKSNNK